MNKRMWNKAETGSCGDYEALLADLAEDRLDESSRPSLHAHLNSCPACRSKLDELRDTFSILARAAAPAAGEPDDIPFAQLHDRVWDGLRRSEERRARPLTWAPVFAACIVMLLALGWWLTSDPSLPDAGRRLADIEQKGRSGLYELSEDDLVAAADEFLEPEYELAELLAASHTPEDMPERLLIGAGIAENPMLWNEILDELAEDQSTEDLIEELSARELRLLSERLSTLTG